MLGLLKFSLLDLTWVLAFLYMSITTMSHFIEAYLQISISKSSNCRRKLLGSIRAGNAKGARVVMGSTRDPLLKALGVQIKAFLERKYNSRNLFRETLERRLNSVFKVEIPHGESLNSFCGDILYVGFFGTIVSQFCLFSKFDMNVNEFSEIFVYMGMAMKSSAFGIAASFIASRGLVFLGRKLEARDVIAKEFCSELEKLFSSYTTERKGTPNAKQARKCSNNVC
jgi:biopolymer transport protein ExbB/TolQ